MKRSSSAGHETGLGLFVSRVHQFRWSNRAWRLQRLLSQILISLDHVAHIYWHLLKSSVMIFFFLISAICIFFFFPPEIWMLKKILEYFNHLVFFLLDIIYRYTGDGGGHMRDWKLLYWFHNAGWRQGCDGGSPHSSCSGLYGESCSLACDRHTALLLTSL